MKLGDLQRESLHHAYIISGGEAQLGELLTAVESLLGIELAGNPDVLVLSDNALTVEMARGAVSRAGSAPMVAGGLKVIILAFTQVTIEAQNALLKTLEEPSESTYIFILTPNPSILLPTVLSRCMQVTLGGGANVSASMAQDFVIMPIQKRIKTIEQLVKKKDKPAMMQLLSALELYLSEHKPQDSDDVNKWKQGTKAVLKAQEYIRDKGAMSKMLMESVALVV